MKTENLKNASAALNLFFAALREAHTDAVNSENKFAEIALYDLLEDSAKLRTRINDILAAENSHP